MIMPKVIEILELNVKEAGKKMPPDVKDAVNIGIEASKRYYFLRSLSSIKAFPLLPGETLEE